MLVYLTISLDMHFYQYPEKAPLNNHKPITNQLSLNLCYPSNLPRPSRHMTLEHLFLMKITDMVRFSSILSHESLSTEYTEHWCISCSLSNEVFLPGVHSAEDLANLFSHSRKPFESVCHSSCSCRMARTNSACCNKDSPKPGFAESKCHHWWHWLEEIHINLAQSLSRDNWKNTPRTVLRPF